MEKSGTCMQLTRLSDLTFCLMSPVPVNNNDRSSSTLILRSCILKCYVGLHIQWANSLKPGELYELLHFLKSF